MVGAGDNVGDDFGVRRIRDRGFKDAYNRGIAIAEAAA
jgi:hypothetical protein